VKRFLNEKYGKNKYLEQLIVSIKIKTALNGVFIKNAKN